MKRRIPDSDEARARAVERYMRTLASGRQLCRVDGRGEEQVERFEQGYERNALRTMQLHEVLDRLDVPRTSFLACRNFALRVDRYCRRHEGETLRVLVEEAIARSSASGLDPSVLRRICEDVFGLEPDSAGQLH